MSKGRILVVDDEEDILELVKYNLEREGYLVDCVDTGEEAIERAVAIRPDGILLDLMLPGVDGIEVCRELRKNPDTRTIPIIMMTAKGEEADVVSGLEVGADDYVPKPFSTKVLVARLRALLRRTAGETDSEAGSAAARSCWISAAAKLPSTVNRWISHSRNLRYCASSPNAPAGSTAGAASSTRSKGPITPSPNVRSMSRLSDSGKNSETPTSSKPSAASATNSKICNGSLLWENVFSFRSIRHFCS